MKITPQKTVEQNKPQIALLKTFEFTSYIMGYHVYKDLWSPVKGEMVKVLSSRKTKKTNLLLRS